MPTPAIAIRSVLNTMAVDKVTEDNPTLASFEDPVNAAYTNQAISILKGAGYSTVKTNVDALVIQLKETDERSESLSTPTKAKIESEPEEEK